MTEIGLRPRSATELVDAAFQVFRRDPVPFIVATAVFYVPWLLIRTVLDAPLVAGELDWPRMFVSTLFSLLVYSTASAVVMLIARDVYLDRRPDVPGAFRAVVPKIPALIITTLITFALTGLAAMFLFLPALYPIARFFAVRQSIMIEGAGVGGALGRSSELSVGVKGHVLSTLFLAGVITIAVSGGTVMLGSMLSSRMLLLAMSTVVSVVVYPFLAIAQTLLYYDVRIRKEGFDIEYLAGGAPLDTVGEVSG